MLKNIVPPPQLSDIRLLQLKQAVQTKFIEENISVERAWFEEVWYFLLISGYKIEPPESK